MRFVLCDDDQLFTSLIEAMLTDLGHEVVGVGTNSHDSVALVRSANPDVVIVDLALGFNTDFDIVAASVSTGAKTIVFSHTAHETILSQYPVRPQVVEKPDLGERQRVVAMLNLDDERHVVSIDRRERAVRKASGPPLTNVGDAQAFYESLNEAAAGDVLIAIGVPPGHDDPASVAARVQTMMREGDRLLVSPATVRVYLPAGDDLGARSFRARIMAADALPAGAAVRAVILGPDELPADAFDRLKATAPETY